MDQAILEGEAYALGMRGSLGPAPVARGIKAKLTRSSDLAEPVARSFGGAPDDRFTQARLPGIHLRVAKAKAILPPEPRRGFDALVDALLPRIKATEEFAVEREIARCLDAGVDDRLVHILAVHILALRKGE